jgi:predicted nucleotidyltransferase component of viral defense system
MTQAYANALAFLQALEARLRTVAAQRGTQIQGLRLKVAIERLLARLFHEASPPWLLKGGYSMELRFRPQARFTRDLDLTLRETMWRDGRPDRLSDAHEALMAAARRDSGDYFVFTIAPARKELTRAPAGGGEFGVTASVAGRVFAQFHVDVGFGDVELGAPEQLAGDDLLSFAGFAPARVLAIPRAQQFAEKLHAYTHPWTDRVNTRSRDLVDMVLLIERGDLHVDEVRHAVRKTFGQRGKRSVPVELDAPPPSWQAEFPAMAQQAGLEAGDLAAAFDALQAFWRRVQ